MNINQVIFLIKNVQKKTTNTKKNHFSSLAKTFTIFFNKTKVNSTEYVILEKKLNTYATFSKSKNARNTFKSYVSEQVKYKQKKWWLSSYTLESSNALFWHSKKKNKKKYNYLGDIFHFLPLSCFFKNKLTVLNLNILSQGDRTQLNFLLKKTLLIFPFLLLNRIAEKLIASLYSLLILKDSSSLTTFIKQILREIHYKKHQSYFNFVAQLTREIIAPQLHLFNCLGVNIVFRGKLAIGGNARKRSLKITHGVVSSSAKFVKLSRTKSIIRTKTGVVGFSVTIAW